ncbi:Nn.00g030600.m01.CDS01 [Neocucurbitaria sp. VM-36]
MSSNTPYNHNPPPRALPPQQPPQATSTMTLPQILSIPAPTAKSPKPPTDLDPTSGSIRAMPTPQPDAITDTDMLINLLQSNAVPDTGYTWADATNLLHWLVEELTKRLNHLLDMEVVSLPEGFVVPGMIRDMKFSNENGILELIRWCRRGRQRGMEFRAFQGLVERLWAFDFEKDLSVWEIVELIGEAQKRIDGPLEDGLDGDDTGVLASESVENDRSAPRRREVAVFRDEDQVGVERRGEAVDGLALRDKTNVVRRMSSKAGKKGGKKKSLGGGRSA